MTWVDAVVALALAACLFASVRHDWRPVGLYGWIRKRLTRRLRP